MAIAPTPVAALNRAVALAETHGPAAALAIVDRLDLDRAVAQAVEQHGLGGRQTGGEGDR